jgi:hypothetical protein
MVVIIVFSLFGCRFRLKIRVVDNEKEVTFLLKDYFVMMVAPHTCDLLMSMVGFMHCTMHLVFCFGGCGLF